jgi:lysozyme
MARANERQQHSEWVAARDKLATLEAQAVKPAPDVSEFQGDVDWTKIAATGAKYAFVRVSDGDINDARYGVARTDAMRANGLIVGTYHFARPERASNGNRDAGIECAMACYAAWKGGGIRKGDLPLVYDWESEALAGLDPAASASHLIGWLRAYKALRGHRAIVYCNRNAIEVVLPHIPATDTTFLAAHPLWIADPNVSAPTVPAPWASWSFWQYTWTGAIPGVAGDVDLNQFSGTATDLAALAIK